MTCDTADQAHEAIIRSLNDVQPGLWKGSGQTGDIFEYENDKGWTAEAHILPYDGRYEVKILKLQSAERKNKKC